VRKNKKDWLSPCKMLDSEGTNSKTWNECTKIDQNRFGLEDARYQYGNVFD